MKVQEHYRADPSYLRDQAHRCVRLARDCPHVPTSHELEAIGIELMEKAAELDDLLGHRPVMVRGAIAKGETA